MNSYSRQMKTLISWIIANIWEMVTAVAVIIFEVWLFAIVGDLQMEKISLAILGAIGIVICRGITGGAPANNIVADVINMAVLCCIILFAFHLAGADTHIGNAAGRYVVAAMSAFAVAIGAAVYTFVNIDEVVSRRMLFANSNTSLFSQKLQYVFDRFVAVWAALSYTAIVVELIRFLTFS